MDFGLLGELALTGALVGAMYGLVALGIVLIYKTSGTANFAQGAIAMMGAYVAWVFAGAIGLPMWLADPWGRDCHVRLWCPRRAYRAPPHDRTAGHHGRHADVRDRTVSARRGSRISGFGGQAPEPRHSAGAGVPRRHAHQPRLSDRRRNLCGADRRRDRDFQLPGGGDHARGVRRPDRIVVGRHPCRAGDCNRLGSCGRGSDSRRRPLGKHAGRRLESVFAADEGSRHRDPRRTGQHPRRAARGPDRRRVRKSCDRNARSDDRRGHARHRCLRHHRHHPDGPAIRPVRPRCRSRGCDVLPPRRHPPHRLSRRAPALAVAVRPGPRRYYRRRCCWPRRSWWTGSIWSHTCCRG